MHRIFYINSLLTFVNAYAIIKMHIMQIHLIFIHWRQYGLRRFDERSEK